MSGGLTTPLRVPSFRLLLVSQLLSGIGAGVFAVALVQSIVASGERAELGYVLGAGAAGSVAVLLLGGVLADRFRRARLMIVADVVRCAAVVGFAVIGPRGPLGLLVVLSAVVGAGAALFRPAYNSLLRSLIPAEAAQAGNALRSLSGRAAALAGPVLGGLVVSLASARTAFVLDAATFAMSVAALVSISEAKRPPPESGRRESMLSAAVAGIRAVIGRPWVAAVVIQGTVQVAFVIGPEAILLPLVLSSRGQLSAYGALLSAEAAGALVGGVVAGRWHPREPGTVAVLSLLGMSLELAFLITPVPLLALGAAVFLTGWCSSIFGVLWMTAIQHEIPDNLLGRVLSLDALGAAALQPIGLAFTPAVAQAVGLPADASIALGILGASVLALLPVPGIPSLATSMAAPAWP